MEILEKYKKDHVKLELVSFESDLIKLHQDDFLPRYNRIRLTIENKSSETIQDLLLTVTRLGSKIGPENFDTVPIKTYDLKPGTKGKYEIMAFDPFNSRFNDLEVRVTTSDDWEKRKKVQNWLDKADTFSKRLDRGIFKLFG